MQTANALPSYRSGYVESSRHAHFIPLVCNACTPTGENWQTRNRAMSSAVSAQEAKQLDSVTDNVQEKELDASKATKAMAAMKSVKVVEVMSTGDSAKVCLCLELRSCLTVFISLMLVLFFLLFR